MTADLAAGPEMDAEVARRVMGLDVEPREQHDWQRVGTDLRGTPWLQCQRCPFGEWEDDEPFIAAACTPAVPPYSSDIAAAWEIVEHLRGEWWVKVWEPRKDMWAVTFGDVRADSPSLSEAICRAALLAAASREARDE